MKHKIYLFLLVIVLILIAALTITVGNAMRPMGQPREVFIDADDTADSVITKMNAPWVLRRLLHTARYKLHTGYYAFDGSESPLTAFRLLKGGHQTPIRLTIPSVRTIGQLSAYLGEKLMMDSTAIASLLEDPTTCESFGKSKETVISLFLPDTYECYWNVSPEALLNKMKREYDAYWTAERSDKAKKQGLTREQVATLASIVDEETNYGPEKPRVAGLYLNRLRKGMLLQADPTVKFAIGDFSLKRIRNQHLTYESPYNTYLHKGLPPGPIRLASKEGIEAVLNAEQHPFLYMCAKEDFSGAHNFAANYNDHLANARRYTKELNRRGF